MMRTIKFRAWSKYGILSWLDLCTTLDPMELVDLENRNYIFMQFTGLFDKNGKEIYESDKIIWKCSGSIIEGIVYWSNDGWWVKDLRGGNTTRLGKASTISVVGNTYEN